MPKKKPKKDLAKEQISFRCTTREKKWIQRNAAKKGVKQKEFIMDSIKYYISEEKKYPDQAVCACEVQAIVNYLNRKHKNDSYIEEVCTKLWEQLN